MIKKLSRYIQALILFMAVQAYGEDLDFQLRIPLHLQYSNIYSNNVGSFGIAAWNVFGDVTAHDRETATLSIAGPLWKYDNKGSWLEVMGGWRRSGDGYNEPVADLRFLDRTIRRLNIFGEVAYFPRVERRRFLTTLAIDTPIPLGSYKIRIGFESENIISCIGKPDSFGIGPRLVLPIPFNRISPSLSAALAMTYQYRNDRDFFRCYLGVTYAFGKK